MATKSEVAAARAKAQQAESESRARAAEAQARSVEAQTRAASEQARIAADQADRQRSAAERAAKEARANDPINRGISLAMATAGPIVGIVAGKKLAGAVEARYNLNVAARNTQLGALAKEVTSATKAFKAARSATTKAPHLARIAGAVKATDKLRLASRASPLGVATAGLLLVEGAYARFALGPSAGSETAREGFSALGTASAFAATTLVGDRYLASRTPSAILDARALGVIEGGRKMLPATKVAKSSKAITAVAKPAASFASTAGRLVTRASSTVAIGAVGAIGFDVGRKQAAAAGFDSRSATSIGIGTGIAAAGTTVGAGVVASKVAAAVGSRMPAIAGGLIGRMALRAVPVVGVAATVIGAVSAYREHGTLKAAALGAVGLDGVIAKPAAAAAPAASPRLAAGRQALASAAAVRTVAEMRAATVSQRAAAIRAGTGNGLVAAYTRKSAAGRVVQVKGYRRG